MRFLFASQVFYSIEAMFEPSTLLVDDEEERR